MRRGRTLCPLSCASLLLSLSLQLLARYGAHPAPRNGRFGNGPHGASWRRRDRIHRTNSPNPSYERRLRHENSGGERARRPGGRALQKERACLRPNWTLVSAQRCRVIGQGFLISVKPVQHSCAIAVSACISPPRAPRLGSRIDKPPKGRRLRGARRPASNTIFHERNTLRPFSRSSSARRSHAHNCAAPAPDL